MRTTILPLMLAVAASGFPASAGAQARLDTLGAQPGLGIAASPALPEVRAPAGRPSPSPVTQTSRPLDFSDGSPPLPVEGEPIETPGVVAPAEPCSPRAPCLRTSMSTLTPPPIASGTPVLELGVPQDLSSMAARNSRAVDDLVQRTREAEDAENRRARESAITPGAAGPAVPDSRTAGAPAPAASEPPPPARDRRGPTGVGPCSNTSDITQLLSRSCLETLRSLRPGGGEIVPSGGSMPVPSISPPVQTQVSCGVAMFTPSPSGAMTPVPGGMVSFQVPDLPRCIEAAVRLGFGVPGLTNVTASVPGTGVFGITCYRPPHAPATVACSQQPSAR